MRSQFSVALVAHVALAVVACDDDDPVRHLADAPRVTDGAIDAALDAAPPRVTVTVFGDGGSMPNVPVYFQSSDGALVATAMTDASGNASAEAPANSIVTVFDAAQGMVTLAENHSIQIWLGVQPGDHLFLDSSAGSMPSVPYALSVPNDPAVAYYHLLFGCDLGRKYFSTANGTVENPTGTLPCLGTTSLHLAGYAADNTLVKTAYRADVALSANATIAFDTFAPPPPASTASFTNVPAKFDGLRVEYGQAIGDDRFADPRWATDLTIANGTANGSIVIDAIPGATLVENVALFSTSGPDRHELGRWGTLGTLDVGANMIRGFAEQAPSYDATTRTITIHPAAAGLAPDAMRLALDARRGEIFTYIEVVAPYAETLVIPPLPAPLESYLPTQPELFRVDATVSRATGGYANLRPFVYALENIPGFASTTASGEYQTATYVGVLSKHRARR